MKKLQKRRLERHLGELPEREMKRPRVASPQAPAPRVEVTQVATPAVNTSGACETMEASEATEAMSLGAVEAGPAGQVASTHRSLQLLIS